VCVPPPAGSGGTGTEQREADVHRDVATAPFRQVVDGRAGAIRVGGSLTPRTAGLLAGTVQALRTVGRTRVVLDLRGLEAADELGLRVVRSLRERVTAAGGRLTLHLPDGPLLLPTGP
jgi:STAS domain